MTTLITAEDKNIKVGERVKVSSRYKKFNGMTGEVTDVLKNGFVKVAFKEETETDLSESLFFPLELEVVNS